MPLVILHHFLNVSVQLANKRGLKKFVERNSICFQSTSGNSDAEKQLPTVGMKKQPVQPETCTGDRKVPGFANYKLN
jgi:hypothetical protein